jgi:predicted enzyme related to lactoylglutathione lyase
VHLVVRLLVNIDVDDLENGIRFYEDGLGLRLERRLFDGTVAEIHGASSKIYLLERPTGSTATPDVARTYARHWTPVHLDLIVEDVEAAAARAEAAGAKRETVMRSYAWGEFITMSDPFGHGFCLLRFRNQDYGAS